jgi:hypothetical protein
LFFLLYLVPPTTYPATPEETVPSALDNAALPWARMSFSEYEFFEVSWATVTFDSSKQRIFVGTPFWQLWINSKRILHLREFVSVGEILNVESTRRGTAA